MTTVDLSDRAEPRYGWLVLCGWTALWLISAVILRLQERLPIHDALLGAFVNIAVLGTLVWLAGVANARWGLWKHPPFRVVVFHVALGIVALAAWALVQTAVMRILIGPAFWNLVFSETWMFQLFTAGMTYAAGTGVSLTFQGFTRDRLRTEREAQLELVAREAELRAIKAQLQPHFLLNSLNSVLALIRHDQAEAEQMVVRLASLLHGAFDRLEQDLVPLEPELDLLRTYLEVERVRFRERLSFEIRLASEAAQILVPPLFLQPLVENAVRHGIEPHTKPGTVTIDAGIHHDRLRITVTNTAGAPNALSTGTGRGLDLTQRRLDSVYGKGATSLSTERQASGFTVTLDLPASHGGD